MLNVGAWPLHYNEDRRPSRLRRGGKAVCFYLKVLLRIAFEHLPHRFSCLLQCTGRLDEGGQVTKKVVTGEVIICVMGKVGPIEEKRIEAEADHEGERKEKGISVVLLVQGQREDQMIEDSA